MLKTFIGALTLGLAVATYATPSMADGANDCKIALKGDNDVVKACQAGGVKRAKQAMKSMTKLAKAGGMPKIDCDSCHKNEEDWKLTDNGEADFKKMLEIVAKAK